MANKKSESSVRVFRPRVRRRVLKECEKGSSRTKQSDAQSSNINFIMKKYGGIPQSQAQFTYGDVSEIPSYETCLRIVMKGQAIFDSLPSNVRARFSNDANKFLEFAQDPANKAEAIRLGLIPEDVIPPAPPLDPNAGKVVTEEE